MGDETTSKVWEDEGFGESLDLDVRSSISWGTSTPTTAYLNNSEHRVTKECMQISNLVLANSAGIHFW